MAAVKAALAVFVKTPARSPVKTRLAADIGQANARAVYEESLRLLRRQLTAAAAAGVAVHWAVGEEDAAADECWRDFPALWTGAGTLGERLFNVYSTLRDSDSGGGGGGGGGDSLGEKAKRVILIGADCPQLTAQTILQAAAEKRTVIGPATDGGFYLFAASRAVRRAQWLAPRYSCASTLAMLQAALTQEQTEHRENRESRENPENPAPLEDITQEITLLPPLTDIDDVASLAQCARELLQQNNTDGAAGAAAADVQDGQEEAAARLRRYLPPSLKKP